jgi:hypothetical protein
MVARSGRPEHYVTWSDPSRDPALRKALKAMRVLTVHQQLRGGKKDFGVVGLEAGRNAQFFVFPRSLRPFAGARVVAIDYAAADENLSVAPPQSKPRSASPHPQRSSRPKAGAASGSSDDRTTDEPRRADSEAEPPHENPPPVPPTLLEIERTVAASLRDLKQQRYSSAAKRLQTLHDAFHAAASS